MRDIAPPVDVFPWPWWVVAIAVVVGVAVLALGVWLVVRAIKRRPPPLPPSARSVAIRELERLRAEMGEIGRASCRERV